MGKQGRQVLGQVQNRGGQGGKKKRKIVKEVVERLYNSKEKKSRMFKTSG